MPKFNKPQDDQADQLRREDIGMLLNDDGIEIVDDPFICVTCSGCHHRFTTWMLTTDRSLNKFDECGECRTANLLLSSRDFAAATGCTSIFQDDYYGSCLTTPNGSCLTTPNGAPRTESVLVCIPPARHRQTQSYASAAQPHNYHQKQRQVVTNGCAPLLSDVIGYSPQLLAGFPLNHQRLADAHHAIHIARTAGPDVCLTMSAGIDMRPTLSAGTYVGSIFDGWHRCASVKDRRR